MPDTNQSPNRLLKETSPYLQQHAHNPVDWYPWGPEALELARKLDRPIFLSIGYSACHWCHVMEHESFEDPDTAKLLNENFVNIKVDREERPDLDQIYMTAVQALTGQGGWPMSVWLTPNLEPFYGGTYFPPDDRYGRPSFKRVLHALSEAWRSRREEIGKTAGQIASHIREAVGLPASQGRLAPDLLHTAASFLERIFDQTYGGFGQAPKFPHPIDLRVLLRVWKRFHNEDALRMARLTLDQMARGGIYDHLGGGFHRYSTDARWLVPHFEKMLYDNALLSIANLEAYQASEDHFYREVAEQTLHYVLREMTSPEGPFYSTQDADSEGVEGKFFVWSADEIENLLGTEAANIFTYVYDVTKRGNWEGHNILYRTKTDEQDARMLGIPIAALQESLAASRAKLFAARENRVKPGRDEKVLTSWNGLMIEAFAVAAQVCGHPEYERTAVAAANFILANMRSDQGRLFRSWKAGSEPKLNGYQEDYAFLINGLITLYEAAFEERWLAEAVSLADSMIEEFWDEAQGGFYFTGVHHEQLLSRTKDWLDSSTPSGNSVAVLALLRLGKYLDRKDYWDKAAKTLELVSGAMNSSPMATGQMVLALDFYLGPVDEFAVLGQSPDTMHRALDLIRLPFRPNKVVAARLPNKERAAEVTIPLLESKNAGGAVTTYICRDYTCKAPIQGIEQLESALKEEAGESGTDHSLHASPITSSET
jgi:uncharacterized protein YyaL (SSP411 family)